MREVFDIIRQAWVAATPEEIVRQTWIQRMVFDLKFPKHLLAVEKELQALPHLSHDRSRLPARRVDLLCFMKTESDLKPLLLVECKESALTEEALQQAIAYNHYVQAPYVAVVNQSKVRFCFRKQEIARFPTYQELIEGLHG